MKNDHQEDEISSGSHRHLQIESRGFVATLRHGRHPSPGGRKDVEHVFGVQGFTFLLIYRQGGHQLGNLSEADYE